MRSNSSPAITHRTSLALWPRRASRKSRRPSGQLQQVLVNSRICALGKRPICHHTGIVIVFLDVGMAVRWEGNLSVKEMVKEGVRRGFMHPNNLLRRSVLADPDGARTNIGDNAPAVIHTRLVPGVELGVEVAAKGGGRETKAKFAVLNPGDSVADWVLFVVPELGAGRCPPGVLGVGGTPEKAMLLAKEAMTEPINIQAPRAPATGRKRCAWNSRRPSMSRASVPRGWAG